MKSFVCVTLFCLLGCLASLLDHSTAAPQVDDVSYRAQFKSLGAVQQNQLIEMEHDVSRFSSLCKEKDNMFVTMSSKETVLQSTADTLQKLKVYGSVNKNVDIISLVSISKINSLYSQRAAKGDKTLMTEYHANLTGDTWGDDPRTFYYFSLQLGSPKFFFDPTRQELAMGFTFANGSTVMKHLGFNGKETTLDVSGAGMTAKIDLAKIQGEIDAFSVALNISQTKFAVNFGSNVDPGVVPYFQVAIQKFFIENFHDKDYVLGTVILNPDSSPIIPSLIPKVFKMKIVPDVQRPNNGDGFLALFIQTTTTDLPDNYLTLPSEFNLVPDGFDTALYITNQNFYKNVLKESFTGIKSLEVTTDSRGMYSVTDGSLPTFRSAYYINGCHLTNLIFTCTWTNNYDGPVTPAKMKQRDTGNAKELTFDMSSSTDVNYCDALCRSSSQSATQQYSSTYTFGIASNSDEVTITGTTDATNHLPSSSGWSNFWTNTGVISGNFDSYSGEISRYMSYNMPKISNLNIFRVNRLLFPDRQIYQFKDVNLVADLVMWGDTVAKI